MPNPNITNKHIKGMEHKKKRDRPVRTKKRTKGGRRVTFYIGPLDIHGGITGPTYGILFSSPFCCVPKKLKWKSKIHQKTTRLALSLGVYLNIRRFVLENKKKLTSQAAPVWSDVVAMLRMAFLWESKFIHLGFFRNKGALFIKRNMDGKRLLLLKNLPTILFCLQIAPSSSYSLIING